MIRRLLLPLVLSSSMLLSGCYTLTMQAESTKPVLINKAKSARGYFKHEERVMYYFFGLVNTNPDAVNKMLAPHRSKALKGLNVTAQMDLIAGLTSAITLGLVGSRVIVVEGNEE